MRRRLQQMSSIHNNFDAMVALYIFENQKLSFLNVIDLY